MHAPKSLWHVHCLKLDHAESPQAALKHAKIWNINSHHSAYLMDDVCASVSLWNQINIWERTTPVTMETVWVCFHGERDLWSHFYLVQQGTEFSLLLPLFNHSTWSHGQIWTCSSAQYYRHFCIRVTFLKTTNNTKKASCFEDTLTQTQWIKLFSTLPEELYG